MAIFASQGRANMAIFAAQERAEMAISGLAGRVFTWC